MQNPAAGRPVRIPRRASVLLIAALFLLTGASEGEWHPGWRSGTPLNEPRAGAGVVRVGNRIYVVGGVDGVTFLNSSEYSFIGSDGSLGVWRKATPLKEERGFLGAVAHKGFVYAVAGAKGPSGHMLLQTVERSRVLSDGSLGPWETEATRLIIPRRCAKVVVAGDYLYATGGYGGVLLDSVERARILPDGHLGEWELLDDHMTVARYINTAKRVGRRIYVLGGHKANGEGDASVEWSYWDDEKGAGPWQESTPLSVGRYGLQTVLHGDTLYAMGGLPAIAYVDVVEKVAVGEDGELGSWQRTTPLPMPLGSFGAVTHANTIYLVGGANADGYYANTFYATFDAKGDIGVYGPAEVFAARVEPGAARALPNGGTVTEAIRSGRYTYVHVTSLPGDEEEWIVGPEMDLAKGDLIRFANGILIQQFHSPSLKRDFPKIRFVDKIDKVDGTYKIDEVDEMEAR